MTESKKTALKGMLILITLCVLSSAGGYRLGKASYDQGYFDGAEYMLVEFGDCMVRNGMSDPNSMELILGKYRKE